MNWNRSSRMRLFTERSSTFLRPRQLSRLNLALTFFVSIYAFWLASDRTWNPDGVVAYGLGSEFFFWSQAKSLLAGHLYVASPPQGWIECFTPFGKCYGYFGIGPSILRIPGVLLFGDSLTGLGPLFVAIAVALAFWSSMDLVRLVLSRYTERNPAASAAFVARWLVVVGAFLGPGSVLVLLARGRVYEEGIVWGAAFSCLTLNLVYRWSMRRSDWYLLGATLTASMAALSRPSAIPVAFVLGVGVIVVGWRQGGRSTRLLGLVMATAPAALFAAVFVGKFGSLNFPWKVYSPYVLWGPFRDTILSNNGNTTGIRFTLTTLANYFRPDSIRVQFSEPWVTLGVTAHSDLFILPGARSEQIWAIGLPSLTNVMPIPLMLTGVALVSQSARLFKHRLKDVPLMPAFMLVGCLAGGVPMLMYYAVAGRYLGDLYPLLAVGTAFSLPIVLDYARSSRRLSGAICPVFAAAAAASCFVLYQIRDSVY